MTILDFKKAAMMARTIVCACTEVSKHHYARKFVLAAFEQTISSASNANAAADTQTDYFNDGFYLLRDAIRVGGVWKDFWSDFHHNGRPSRWLKVTDDLALHGKAESILVLKDCSDLYRRELRSPHEEIWELHQRDRTKRETQSIDDLVYERIREEYLPGSEPEEGSWHIKPFSLQVHSGRRIENLGRKDQRLENTFYAFVFPGLEVLGYQTPVLCL